VKASEVIQALAALASESRLAVFRLLVKRGPEGFTPSVLSERLQVPAPTLSFHLKELVRAGLVKSRREGRNLYYEPNIKNMKGLVAFLTENCCTLAGETCDEDCKPVASAAEQRDRKRA
jgi:DNA-binding transcriptional ArsR family regulator